MDARACSRCSRKTATDRRGSTERFMSVAVLISGRGSNLHALLDAGLPITTVISSEAEAKGRETAAARGVATRLVEHRRFSSREEFDAARVLRQEHVIYPRAVRWFLEDKLVIEGNRVRVKGNDAQLVFAVD